MILGQVDETTSRLAGAAGDAVAWCLLAVVLLTAGGDVGATASGLAGMQAIFVAFVLGLILPRGPGVERLVHQIEPPTRQGLLPLYFAYTGLQTSIGLLDTPGLWGVTAAVVGVAVSGKGVACALAARWTGYDWRDAWAVGALMNARGLMELLVLEAGLARRLITPTLFTVMVVMTVLTTSMTGPLFDWILRAAVRPMRRTFGRASP